jgi:DNA-binding NarL/FixJ family response regulator
MDTKIRILVAEDTTLIRQLLSQQLARETDFNLVGEAENGQEAVRLAFDLHPDVILMDIYMPVLNGIQATAQILAREPQIRVLLLTGHDDLASISKMTGAVDCIKKSCTPTELVAAIRAAYDARELTPLSPVPRNLCAVIERLGTQVHLTDREQAVVMKMVSTDDTVVQIAHALSLEWQQPVTESAVKHTIERAMNKLQIEPRTRATLVKFVIGQVILIGQVITGS